MTVHKHHKWTEIEKVIVSNSRSELQFCKCGRVRSWDSTAELVDVHESMAHLLDKDSIPIHQRKFTVSDRKAYNFYQYGDTDYENFRVQIVLNMKVMTVKSKMSYSDLIELAGYTRDTRGVSVIYNSRIYEDKLYSGMVDYGDKIDVTPGMIFNIMLTNNA